MQTPSTVKYIVGIITNEEQLREKVLDELAAKLGRTDHISEWHPFDLTNYYENEMGKDLKRCFVSFKEPRPAEELVTVKNFCIEIENKFSHDKNRRINIDPGYLDHFKFVLASHKFGGHRIALSKDCFADMLMYFEKGRFHPFPWCYPDLSNGTYDKDLIEVRNLFKQACHSERSEESPAQGKLREESHE